MKDLVVFADNRQEMIASQNQIIEWASGKLSEAQMNLQECSENLDHAKTMKWKLSGWQNQTRIARKKVEFYEKIHAALSAGYVIVPDFPIDIFAVRTNRQYPVPFYRTDRSEWDNTDRTQPSEVLALGEGKYVDGEPVERYQKVEKVDDTQYYRHFADEYKDMDFPIKAVKPAIIEKTSKALALKIFDEIGVNPGRQSWQRRQQGIRTGGDPMVIGRIIYRRPGDSFKWVGWRQIKSISFMIAWWLKTSDLEV